MIPAVIISSAFLMYLFIRRSVTGRILALEHCMREHVRGRPVPVPAKGHDEITSMAQSLSYFIQQRREYEADLKSSLQEKEVLLQEVHHRVKNNMQVITSLLRLQAGKIEDKQYADMFKDAENRIRSMALIHEKIYQTKDFANIEFSEYAKSLTKDLFRFYGINAEKVKLRIEIGHVALGLDNAIPCGLIINELVSNSLKYAFPKDREGDSRSAFGQ
jgi:two-component sensor histidine kinase